MPTIPLSEPALIVAGDTLRFRREDLGDSYPADQGWSLTYEARSAAGAITFVAAASGRAFDVNIAVSTTAGWTAGRYDIAGYVAKAGERYQIYRGTITVAPNLAAAGAADRRSHARKVLDAIEAVIEKRASLDQESYEIDGRSLKRTPIADLLKLRSLYKAEIAREDAAARVAQGLSPRRRILVRFSGAR
ncbi:MAG: hypothetical protein NBV67_00350 [Tagaea sp.]|nr:hypothetical protein [Tagaea sp.]